MKKMIYLSLACTLLLGACSTNETTESTDDSTETATVSPLLQATSDTFGTYEEEDLNTSSNEAVSIELSENTTATDGVTVDGQTVTITQEGTYHLTGELTNGQVIVNVDKEEKVHLILDGVTITNSNGPAILIEQSEKVITTLEKDTVNTLTDGADYDLADDETEPDAAFFSKEDLVLNGEGELVVTGNYNNGIRSKDDLIFISGTYTVTAVNNALKGKDSVQILDGIYTLTTTEGDGIQANNADEADKGYVAIDGGRFTITSGRDGVQAETTASLQLTDMTITTGEETLSDEESYKGIKAGTAVFIQSGTYNIDSADDSLHTNGDLTILAGDFSLTSGDDGIHADNLLTIEDGTLTVTDSYEGLEASEIVINGGDLHVTASDDGLNAGGGSDANAEIGFFGQDSFDGSGQMTDGAPSGTPGEPPTGEMPDGEMPADDAAREPMTPPTNDATDTTDEDATSDSATDTTGRMDGGGMGGGGMMGGGGDQADDSKSITINGGTLYVNAQGDGLDSNGNIAMTGGTVIVDGPTNGGNGSLDYNGTFELTGGTLITAGSTGMALNVSDSSSQASLGIYFDSVQAAGTIISIEDSSGNTVATYQPGKEFQHVLFSSSELKVGETYTLVSGSEANGTSQDGYYGTESIINGKELGTLTLSNTITNLSEAGEEVQGGMMGGGMMGGGGGQMPQDRQNQTTTDSSNEE